MMIYLDNNATTALDREVKQLIERELSFPWPINPSGIHACGREGKKKLSQSRETVAHILGVKPHEVIFTSGGTESINLVLRGFLNTISPCERGEILTSSLEHAAVLRTLESARKNLTLTCLPVNERGSPSLHDIERNLTPQTKLLVFMAANNETGVKTEWKEIATLAERLSLPLIVDGIAWFGKEKWEGIPSGVSAFCLSGHKIHAPQGTGIAVIRRQLPFLSPSTGGGQEGGRRSGTENLPVILALAKAMEIVYDREESFIETMRYCRDLFEKEIFREFPYLSINGTGERVSNVSNLAFHGIDSESLFIQLDQAEIFASYGSACSSGLGELSHVLLAMGYTRKRVRSSLRFSFSRMNTEEEVLRTVSEIRKIITKIS